MVARFADEAMVLMYEDIFLAEMYGKSSELSINWIFSLFVSSIKSVSKSHTHRKPLHIMPRCIAIKADGHGCRANAKNGSVYCVSHLSMADVDADVDADLDLPIPVPTPAPPASAPTVNEEECGDGSYPDIINERINTLSTQLEYLSELIGNLNIQTGHKPVSDKPVSDKRVNQRARWLFYQDAKTRPDIMANLKPRLESAGLLVKQTVVVGGVEMLVDKIPWVMVKSYTDMLFDNLSVADTAEYKRKAVDAIVASG